MPLSHTEKLYLQAARCPCLYLPWGFEADRASFEAVRSLLERKLLDMWQRPEGVYLSTTNNGRLALAEAFR